MNNFYEAKVIAGQPYVAPYSGQFFAISDTGAARSVSLQFVQGGAEQNMIKNMAAGFETQTQFDRVILYSDIDTVVQFFASATPVRLGIKDGLRVEVPNGVKITNDTNSRIPVDIAGGQITVTATGVEVSNDNAKAIPTQIQRLTVIVDIAAVTLTAANQKYKISDDATLKRLRIRNAHESAVIYIGGVGLTAENAALMLMPGDLWIEDDAASAAWYAIADKAGAVVKLQGLK